MPCIYIMHQGLRPVLIMLGLTCVNMRSGTESEIIFEINAGITGVTLADLKMEIIAIPQFIKIHPSAKLQLWHQKEHF